MNRIDEEEQEMVCEIRDTSQVPKMNISFVRDKGGKYRLHVKLQKMLYVAINGKTGQKVLYSLHGARSIVGRLKNKAGLFKKMKMRIARERVALEHAQSLAKLPYWFN